MSLSEHLTSCGAWTGHSCTCWLDRHPEVAEDPKDTRITELEALKDQYCDECKHESYCGVLAAAYEEFNDLGDGGRDFSCNRWTDRSTK